MSEVRKALGLSGLALLPICCLGVPLLIAAGISVAALTLIAGITVGAIACAAAIALLIARRPEAKSPWRRPSPSARGGAHTEGRTERGTAAAGPAGRGRPLVDILSFAGCPNHLGAIELVERVSGGLGLDPEIRVLDVPDRKAALRLRFLGSPTIRVGGRDVDPHAEERTDYGFSCRLFRTEAGIAGQPDERWVRDALLREAGGG